MADKVRLSKDSSTIEFSTSEALPSSGKKFRQAPEIEGFFRFIYENGLPKEAYEVLTDLIARRKATKAFNKKSRRKKQ